MTPRLSLSGIEKAFGSIKVLHGVSLTVLHRARCMACWAKTARENRRC